MITRVIGEFSIRWFPEKKFIFMKKEFRDFNAENCVKVTKIRVSCRK